MLVLTGVTATMLYAQGIDHLDHVWRSGRAPDRYFEQTEYPIEAVRWVRSHRRELGTRLYNDYGVGGFFSGNFPENLHRRPDAGLAHGIGGFSGYVELNREDSPQVAVLDRYGVDWG